MTGFIGAKSKYLITMRPGAGGDVIADGGSDGATIEADC